VYLPERPIPFPRCVEWSKGLRNPARAEFDEFYRNVASHLTAAVDATRGALGLYYNPRWRMDISTHVGYIDAMDVDGIVERGNAAVRAADSSLDMALQLLNHVLVLGIPKRDVRWNAEPRPGSLHAKIANLTDPGAASLVLALKHVYNSMGYQGLDRYRDWLTHRGAPHTEWTRDAAAPVPLPPEALAIEDPASRGLRLWGHLWGIANTSVYVTCATFVPPVQAQSGVFTVSWGGLAADAEEYRRRNPTPMDSGRVQDAGELLGRYPLVAYVPGVAEIVSFVVGALSNDLDAPLADLLRSR
jgi:hypothetical protein